MNLESLLAVFIEKKVSLKIENGQLKYTAPQGVMTDEMLSLLRANKTQLIDLLNSSTGNNVTTYSIEKRRRSELGDPLSFAQQRLWSFNLLKGSDEIGYNVLLTLKLDGELNFGALEESVKAIIERHEILRTCFESSDSGVVQKVVQNLRFSIERNNDKNINLHDLIGSFYSIPFDLSSAPLIRAKLVNLSPKEHILIVVAHHIVCDGWSLRTIFTNELQSFYRAFSLSIPVELQLLLFQYADYAHWQHTYDSTAGVAYWKETLDGYEDSLYVPRDYLPSTDGEVFAGFYSFDFPAEFSSRLSKFAQQHNCTLFMVLLASLYLVVSRFSERDDVCIGTTVAGRNILGLENLLGTFVNILPLRLHLNKSCNIQEFLTSVRKLVLKSFDNQEITFEQILTTVSKDRSDQPNPLVPIMMRHQSFPETQFARETELSFSFVDTLQSQENSQLNIPAKCEIDFAYYGDASGLKVVVEYATTLFHKETINRFLKQQMCALENMMADTSKLLSEIKLVTPADEQLLEQGFAGKTTILPVNTILDRFETQAKLSIDRFACCDDLGFYSYLDLQKDSNRLAQYLLSQNFPKEGLIGICLNRNRDLLISILGVWKAGLAYVPLDSSHPQKYLNEIIGHSKPLAVIANQYTKDVVASNNFVLLSEIILGQPDDLPSVQCRGEQLAYVMFTSGSTGNPKGVRVPHRQIMNWLTHMESMWPFDEKDVFAQKTTIAFAPSVKEMFSGLVNGCMVAFIDAETTKDVTKFVKALKQHNVTRVNLVPSHLQAILTELDSSRTELPFLKICTVAGEPLPSALVEKFRLILPGTRLLNNYGCTELNDICYYDTSLFNLNDGGIVPIGKPIQNTTLYVLDEDEKCVPDGIIGELCVKTSGVSLGYFDNDTLTAERYRRDLFGEGILYKTGDMVRRTGSGELEYIGRRDFQIKIRGQRVDVRQVESILSGFLGIGKCVVMGQKEQLVAFYEPGEIKINLSEMKEKVSELLPDYMVPDVFVKLESFPRLPNGKLNRKLLLNLDFEPQQSISFEPPATTTEQQLALIWSDVLGISSAIIGRHSQFFELGGHSLSSAQVMARVKDQLGIGLALVDMFNHAKLLDLANLIDHKSLSTSASSSEHNSPKYFVDRPNVIPMSYAQRRMWFHYLYKEGKDLAYNLPAATHVKEALDIAALKKALNALVERHEILRTRFDQHSDKFVQIIDKSLNLNIEVIYAANNKIDHYLDENALHYFDLKKGPLLKMTAVVLSANDHVILLNIHHIITDAWSMGIFHRELLAFYKHYAYGTQLLLPELTLQYADYAIWQESELSKDLLEKALAFWKSALEGAPTLLELPTDYPRAANQTFKGSKIYFKLDRSLTESIHEITRTNDVTLFMTLFAAFNLLLQRYSAQTDLVVGTPTAGRSHTELEGLIGLFVNTLAIRTQINEDDNFVELLNQVKHLCLDAFSYQWVPFDLVVEAVNPVRSNSYSPIFQVMFSVENVPVEEPGTLTTEIRQNNHSSLFDLSMNVLDDMAGGLTGSLEFNTDLFDESTIIRFANHFEHLLKEVCAYPTRSLVNTPLILASDIEFQSVICVGQSKELPQQSIHEFIELHANQTPNKIALMIDGSSISYQELNSRSNQVAHGLISQGVKAEDIVGLSAGRSFELVIGLLGILKSGAAYVPIASDYPIERLNFIKNDSRIRWILGDVSAPAWIDSSNWLNLLDKNIWHAYSAENPKIDVRMSQLAYVIYTSGTTGVPKGVLVEHKSIVNLYTAMQSQVFDCTGISNWGWNASYTFDASLQAITALMAGKSVTLIPEHLRLNPQALFHYLFQNNVDALDTTPSQMKLYFENKTDLMEYRNNFTFVIGGEAITLSLWQDLQLLKKDNPVFRFFNVYGPSECAVNSSIAEISMEDLYPHLGRPINNLTFAIFDKENALIPRGLYGELHIAGESVARGYLNQKALTDEKFVERRCPFSNKSIRFYATGDFVRIGINNNLEYLSRKDKQAKLRGFRIELEEIEFAIKRNKTFKEVVVCIKQYHAENYLVAYVVRNDSSHFMKDKPKYLLDSQEFNYLADWLPSYMMPNYYIEIPNLPLTLSGKLNLSLLPDIEFDLVNDSVNHELTTTEEKIIAAVWGEVLGRPSDTIKWSDNFFKIGGHSILSLRVIQKLESLGYQLSIKDFYKNENLRSLSHDLKIKHHTTKEIIHPSGHVDMLSAQINRLTYWTVNPQWFHMGRVMVLPDRYADEAVNEVCSILERRHDSLRTRFKSTPNGEWEAFIAAPEARSYCTSFIENSVNSAAYNFNEVIDGIVKHAKLSDGPLLQVINGYFSQENRTVFIFLIHHLVIDEYSLSIVISEFFEVFSELTSGGIIKPKNSISIREAARFWLNHANSSAVKNETLYWESLPWQEDYKFAADKTLMKDISYVKAAISRSHIQEPLARWLKETKSTKEEFFIALTVKILSEILKCRCLSIAVMDNGRSSNDSLDSVSDFSQVVGYMNQKRVYFFQLYEQETSLVNIIKQLRNTPNQGRNLRQLKTLCKDSEVVKRLSSANDMPEIWFNYLGDYQQAEQENVVELFQNIRACDSTGTIRESCDPENKRYRHLNFIYAINNGNLDFFVECKKMSIVETVANEFAERFLAEIVKIGKSQSVIDMPVEI